MAKIDVSFILVSISIFVLLIIFLWLKFLKRRHLIQEQERNIEEHKMALQNRLQIDETQQRYIDLDISLYNEHKLALNLRIRSEDWFSAFTDLFFSRQSSRMSFDPLLVRKGNEDKVNLNELASYAKSQPVLLIGDAGSGKTTCLNRLAAYLCEDQDEIPLILDLSAYRAGTDILLLMNTERKLDRRTIERALKSGLATVLIDSANETPDQQDALDRVTELLFSYRNNSYILATRTSHYFSTGGRLSFFATFEIQPLTIEQINKFLEKFLTSQQAALRLINLFDQRLLGLSGNPYVLEMIATLYRDTGEIGVNRAEVYQKFLYRFLYHWDRKVKHTVFQGYMENVLASICFSLDQRATMHDIPRVQDAVAESIPRINQKMAQEFDTQTVWNDLITLAIVRLDVRSSRFMFIHQSIQEYYTGLYLWQQINDGIIAYNDLVQKASANEWQESILFAAGLLNDPTPLILQLIDERVLYLAAKCLENSKKLYYFLSDEIIVASLTEFKYGDTNESIAVVSYEAILALRIAKFYCSQDLEPRLRENVEYYITKYAAIDAVRITFSRVQFSADELISRIYQKADPFINDYIWTLGEWNETKATPIMMELLKDPNYCCRVEIVRALGKLGNEKTAELLIQFINECNDAGLIVAIFNTLVQLHNRVDIEVEQIAPSLITYMEHASNPYRDSAAWALRGLVGTDANQVFLKYALKNDSSDLQAMCIYILGELNVQEVAKDLVALLQGEMGAIPNAFVREDLVYTLGSLLKSRIAKAVLIKSLDDSDSVVRMQAINGLAKIGELDDFTLEKIRSLTKHPKRYISVAAKHALTISIWRRWKLHYMLSDKEIITKMDDIMAKLNKLNSRAMALQNRIAETQRKESEGFLDTGRADALLIKYDADRYQIMTDIESLLNDTPMVTLVPVVQSAKRGAPEGEVRAELREVIRREEWGETIWAKIDQYKGEILGMIIVASLEVARYLSGR